MPYNCQIIFDCYGDCGFHVRWCIYDISDCALVNSSILAISCLIDFKEDLQMFRVHLRFLPFSVTNVLQQRFFDNQCIATCCICHSSRTASRQFGLVRNLHKWCVCMSGLHIGNSLSERLVNHPFNCYFECPHADQTYAGNCRSNKLRPRLW